MKNLILYIACIIYTAYVAVMHNSESVVILLFVELFVPIPFFFLSLYQCRKVDVSFHFPISAAEKGRENILEFKIVNPLPVPITRLVLVLTYEHRLFKGKSKKVIKTSLGRKQTKLLSFKLVSNACGLAGVSLKKIRVYDYLGLFFIERKIGQVEELAILPSILESSFNISRKTLDFPLESDYFDSVKGGNDPSEVFQIREYQKGDRPQNIHWKLTAKSEDLMVKEFSRPIGCAVILFLNPKTFSDVFIEIFSALSNRMAEMGCCHYIAWYHNSTQDLGRFMIENQEHLYDLISQLYQDPPSHLEEDSLYLYQDKYKSETFSSWLVLDDSLVLYKNGEPVASFTANNLERELQSLTFDV